MELTRGIDGAGGIDDAMGAAAVVAWMARGRKGPLPSVAARGEDSRLPGERDLVPCPALGLQDQVLLVSGGHGLAGIYGVAITVAEWNFGR